MGSTGAGNGGLAFNILAFVRTLRAAGLPVGPGRVLDAVNAARAVGLRRRDDFYWSLHACLVHDPEHHRVFDQAFGVYFRNPRLLGRLLSVVLPSVGRARGDPLMRRLAEAFLARSPGTAPRPRARRLEVDTLLTASDREILQRKDFEQMSVAELAVARQLIRQLDFSLGTIPTRRHRPGPRGRRIDLRTSLRRSLKSGGSFIPLVLAERRRRPPPLVLLCDISGSMGRYSRLFLHFAHALTRTRDRVATLVFATRLTNISRYLRHRDVDEALEAVSGAVPDWSGGTRIGAAVRGFNFRWSRRLLAQGAVVVLLTDGLERDDQGCLEAEMVRLKRSCRRLIWVNPLLRFERFQPRARGVRKILPHVDDFRPVHNLHSLQQLVSELGARHQVHSDRCPPRRAFMTACSSATIASAIPSGESAPMSRPTGP